MGGKLVIRSGIMSTSTRPDPAEEAKQWTAKVSKTGGGMRATPCCQPAPRSIAALAHASGCCHAPHSGMGCLCKYNNGVQTAAALTCEAKLGGNIGRLLGGWGLDGVKSFAGVGVDDVHRIGNGCA